MKFTAPRGFWQWLACFSPAIINWLAVYEGPRIQFALYGIPDDGTAIWAGARWGIYSLLFGAVLCLGLGGWIVRKSDSFNDIAAGAVLYGFAFMVINAAVAFGGCAIASTAGVGP